MFQPTTCLFVFLTHTWFYPVVVTLGEIHSLTYIYTAFSKPVDLPGIHEFTAMGLLDDRMIDYYDSSIKKKVPKQPWMEERLEKDYWDKGTDSRKSKEQWFKVNLGILKDRMRHGNDTDLHVLQWRHGCKAETQQDKSLKFVSGKDEYSYDGNDYLAFDDVNKRWIAPIDLAVPTKEKWDKVKMLNDYTQGYLERECVNWLSKFVGYAEEDISFKNKEPELHVYTVKSRDPNTINLNCLATGFYPKHVVLQIKRNGRMVDQLDGMQTTGVRPNGDGTYQIMNRVEILRSDCDSAKYSCEVIHPASGTHKIRDWDLSMLCTSDNSGVIIGTIAIAIIALGLALAGAAWFLKKRSDLIGNVVVLSSVDDVNWMKEEEVHLNESKTDSSSNSNESGNGSWTKEEVKNGSIGNSSSDSGQGSGSNRSSSGNSSPTSPGSVQDLLHVECA